MYVSPTLLISCANVMTTTRHISHILNLPTYLYITVYLGISSWNFYSYAVLYVSAVLSCIDSLIHCFNSPYLHDPVA